MGRTTDRPALRLSTEEIDLLEQKSNSRTLPKQEVQRSQILLLYYQKIDISEIRRRVGLSRPSIYKCIDKALAGGTKVGLEDRYHRPKEPVVTDEAKLWVINLACTKPTGIRVESTGELKERILKGVEEINAKPVVHRWGKFEFTDVNL